MIECVLSSLFFKNRDVAHSEPPYFEWNIRHGELLSKTSGAVRKREQDGFEVETIQLCSYASNLNCTHLTAFLKNRIKKKPLPQHLSLWHNYQSHFPNGWKWCIVIHNRVDFIWFAGVSSPQEALHHYVCGHSLVLMEHSAFSHRIDVFGGAQFNLLFAVNEDVDDGDDLFNVPSAQHICWCDNQAGAKWVWPGQTLEA